MKNIVFLLVVLAIAAIAIADTSTATPTATLAATTTATPGPTTTVDPTATTTTTNAPAPAPSARKYALFGTKFGVPATGTGIILGFHEIGTAPVSFALMHNVANPTSITLHGPDASTFYTFPAGNIAPNTLISTPQNPFTATQLSWFFDGKAQVRVNTASSNVNGTIGYAPFAQWAYAGILTSAQTVNPSSSNGVGLMIAGGSGQYLSVEIQHNVTDATRITVNGAATCQNGAQLFNMPTVGLFAGNVFDTASNATFQSMDAGNVYAVISNAANPDGAIRGQIYSYNYYDVNRLVGFENRNCRSSNLTTTTTAAPKSSANGVFPSIFLIVFAIIASLML